MGRFLLTSWVKRVYWDWFKEELIKGVSSSRTYFPRRKSAFKHRRAAVRARNGGRCEQGKRAENGIFDGGCGVRILLGGG
jgi:hypothetical protein